MMPFPRSLHRSSKAAFTLIELLVVIAIIGVLASIVLASLNVARTKARDARRVADIKTIQTALELFFDTCSGYPDVGVTPVILPANANSNPACGGGVNMSRFLSSIPTNPTPNGVAYTYCSTATLATSLPGPACNTGAVPPNKAFYKLNFNLEGRAGSLLPGAHLATPAGIL